MKKNIGKADRLIRFFISLILLTYSWWQGNWIALGLGLFTLYEAVANWCLFYQVIGKNTCPIDQK